MRQFFAISFLITYLLGNTELGQLIKLPLLINHYYQHKKTDNNISFIGFIQMHYITDDGTTADDNDDLQLPCHNIFQSHISSLFAPIIDFVTGVILMPVMQNMNQGGMLYIHKNTCYVNGFGQPPESI